MNSRLRAAIDKALSANMTKDTIQRAIKRGAGNEAAAHMVELCYEGYGPHGVAVLVNCLTDNKNRTIADVRHAFTKTGGSLGTSGSVAYLFKRAGVLHFSSDQKEEAIIETALEAGADDVAQNEEGSVEVVTSPDMFFAVKAALISAALQPDAGEITMLPSTEVELNEEQAATLLRLLDMLEDLDDVQNVYSNAYIAPHILDKL